MAFSTIKNAKGEYEQVMVNGKPVKKSLLNALLKAQKTNLWTSYPEGGIGRNPYSGVTVHLESLELEVYDWCLTWYNLYSGGVMPTPLQTYDNMRYLLLELNSRAYMDLLD